MSQKINHNRNQKIFETNDNENTTCQNLQNATKAMLRVKLMALNACIRKKKMAENQLSKYLPQIVRKNVHKLNPNKVEGRK